MQKTKEVQIGEKKVLVCELKVKDIKTLWRELTEMHFMEGLVPAELTPGLLAIWDKGIVGLKPDEMDEFYQSEISQVWEAFVEVNAPFFVLAAQMEAMEQGSPNPFITALRAGIVKNLMLRFADLSKKDIPESLSTDTVSS